jgi:protein phosphatase
MSSVLNAVEKPTNLRAWGITDKGSVRSRNEDCFRIDFDSGLCLAADGMGGHNAGEVAAHLAADVVTNAVRRADLSGPFDRAAVSSAGNLLRNAVYAANARILQAAAAAPECSGMGTTIVAALVRGSVLSAVHVGDSRLYIFDGGRLRLLTTDDSWTASVLAADPHADPALLQRHPLRNALTNVVGGRAEVDVHLVEEPLRRGEMVLLTTDGVHGALETGQMERILGRSPGDPAAIAGQLVRAALAAGSRDNCTAVLALSLA